MATLCRCVCSKDRMAEPSCAIGLRWGFPKLGVPHFPLYSYTPKRPKKGILTGGNIEEGVP